MVGAPRLDTGGKVIIIKGLKACYLQAFLTGTYSWHQKGSCGHLWIGLSNGLANVVAGLCLAWHSADVKLSINQSISSPPAQRG